MNTKRLSTSLIFLCAAGLSGTALAAGTPSETQSAPSPAMNEMMGHGGMGMNMMNMMGNCPMMGGTHLSGKDSMLMRADIMQAMSNVMRKYADKARD
ncbi:MAG: hypothetical protein KGK15_16885 [Burkholderiales bacterium]|uniref:hypothetical protein n=1 Tax=Pandoraea sp. TaxID=1883445 RepID=UPI0012251D9E|nr:hypothetical protein [Pandoraea sp.]MDE2289939.1 hypothetical protein [Burkholderiales bacterium]MDE2608596.1 hypothetical protein [Burkholderiales bacterium]TAL80519.1 MAG: hypothetical protein EPN77_19785 [Candidimonas sp.]TAM18962.1 MAG: hypothetical protein EPN65_05180 [Pandoraea sp.]